MDGGPRRAVFIPLKSLAREDVPKPQRLIPGTRHNRLSVRRHGQIQHSQRVASQSGQLGERRVPPDDNLVLAVPVRAHELVHVLRPHQVADLRPRVHRMQGRVRGGVPEPDAPVGGASSGRKEAVLVGRPGDGLDRRRVLHEAQPRAQRAVVPDEELVVVAPRGQLPPIGRPLEAANL